MCGRFTLSSDKKAIEEAFPGIVMSEPPNPRYNIAPTQLVATIRNNGRLTVECFHWGLIPHWAKDKSIGHKMINARAESLSEKPSFKEPFRKKRCLILADGFYEWKKGPSGKIPMYIRLRTGRPFAFAGLWDAWLSGAEQIVSCTIITTSSNELVAPIHNRMPVIITEGYSEWLDMKERKPESLQGLLRPYPADEMEAYEVSTKVNDPKAEGVECVERYEVKGLST